MSRERPPQGMGEVRLAWEPAFTAMALTTRGPYWRLSEAFGRIRERSAEMGVEPSGAPLGLFYDDPEATPSEETRYSICYPLDEEDVLKAKDALRGSAAEETAEAAARAPRSGGRFSLVRFPAGALASVEYRGPAAGSPAVYEHLRRWIDERGYEALGAPREAYLAVPGTLGGGQMHALVQQPLKDLKADEG